MNSDHVIDILLEIKSQVSSLESKIVTFSSTLVNHEHRITEIEHNGTEKEPSSKSGFKEELLRLLAKCLLVALTGLASLAGASSILQSFSSCLN